MNAVGDRSSARIDAIELFRLRLPLGRPYRLAYGDVTAFETLLVRVCTADGREGWGETTPLPGYSSEDMPAVWTRSVAWGGALRGLTAGEALSRLDPRMEEHPFACAGLATALESLDRTGREVRATPPRGADPGRPGEVEADPAAPDAPAAIPLAATVRAATPGEAAAEAEQLLEAGYTTLKMKVGREPDADLAAVRAAQRVVQGRGRLRVDANQGYSLRDARAFLDRLDPAGIELFEQPFPVSRWDWTRAVGEVSPVPLMLDESIHTAEDVRRAAGVPGVRFVKFKLMKAGSARRLAILVNLARSLGLGVIVGNGVATDVGCRHEARVAAGRTDLAGEMNGFLKPVESLLAHRLCVEGGKLLVPAGGTEVRRDAVRRYQEAFVSL